MAKAGKAAIFVYPVDIEAKAASASGITQLPIPTPMILAFKNWGLANPSNVGGRTSFFHELP